MSDNHTPGVGHLLRQRASIIARHVLQPGVELRDRLGPQSDQRLANGAITLPQQGAITRCIGLEL